MLKKLSIVMMVGIANLILMSAAVAKDTVEISVDAKNEAGDRLEVAVSGPDVKHLTGMARLICKAGDECLVLLTTSSLENDAYPELFECGEILLHGPPPGHTYVVVNFCGNTDNPPYNQLPFVGVNTDFGLTCPVEPTCITQFVSGYDKLKLVMKGN
jgi:hypothetical protein